MESVPPIYSTATDLKKGYSPPWEDLTIIGIAGSSGSGKSSVSMEIIKSLNLPWVVILVMVLSIPGLGDPSALMSNGLSGLLLQELRSRRPRKGA